MKLTINVNIKNKYIFKEKNISEKKLIMTYFKFKSNESVNLTKIERNKS